MFFVFQSETFTYTLDKLNYFFLYINNLVVYNQMETFTLYNRQQAPLNIYAAFY